MRLLPLPGDWQDTRNALQAYASALTAFPRAGADPDPHWAHVAMDPVPGGFTAAPTPLADGTSLGTILDIRGHRIIAVAGEHSVVYDLEEGPSPRTVGEGIVGLVERHGARFVVDESRFDDRSKPVYRRDHAEAFLAAAEVAIGSLGLLNELLVGEIHGPHLWPHGFDIATEWISARLAEEGGGTAHAQIASGWYPATASYVYINPWPFEPHFTAIDLPHGATWNTEGWNGAKLDVSGSDGVGATEIVDLARAVHEAVAHRVGH
jgi:hypothetical protein